MRRPPHLAVFVASLADGGIGKMRVHLINEIAGRGYRVDLVVADDRSPYMERVAPAVQVEKVRTSNAVSGVPWVAAYLLKRRPPIVLTQRIRVNVLTQRANRLLGSPSRLYVTANTNMTAQLASLKPDKRAHQLAMLRRYYPRNAGIIAISQGVADDLSGILGWESGRIRIAPNPVVTPELYRLAEERLDHPWFAPGQPPVILGVGRLEPQKDFATLLRAFSTVHADRPCRLVILGEGGQRRELQALAAELGIAADLAMPGFVTNPYAYLRHASLFAFSSRWEGFGNALVEALAVGTPVVSTDCPDGPSEILEGGRFGPLVPVGDHAALADAMRLVLDGPPAPDQLRAAAQRYTQEVSATAYLEAMGLDPAGPA
ncbi:MAG: hypothetical protein RLZ44_1343 [Pseudomonadota bacterium]|jgi:glycosyltransferase involved in cell wall biosynthesis